MRSAKTAAKRVPSAEKSTDWAGTLRRPAEPYEDAVCQQGTLEARGMLRSERWTRRGALGPASRERRRRGMLTLRTIHQAAARGLRGTERFCPASGLHAQQKRVGIGTSTVHQYGHDDSILHGCAPSSFTGGTVSGMLSTRCADQNNRQVMRRAARTLLLSVLSVLSVCSSKPAVTSCRLQPSMAMASSKVKLELESGYCMMDVPDYLMHAGCPCMVNREEPRLCSDHAHTGGCHCSCIVSCSASLLPHRPGDQPSRRRDTVTLQPTS